MIEIKEIIKRQRDNISLCKVILDMSIDRVGVAKFAREVEMGKAYISIVRSGKRPCSHEQVLSLLEKWILKNKKV